MSARLRTIDVTRESAVAVCPACSWRAIALDEFSVRREFYQHLSTTHSNEEAQNQRAVQARWLARKGAAA